MAAAFVPKWGVNNNQCEAASFKHGEAIILELEIGRLTKSEVHEAVLWHCSKFGQVKCIQVHEPNCERDYGIAVVVMATPVDAAKVVVNIGDMKFGSVAIIRLRPD